MFPYGGESGSTLSAASSRPQEGGGYETWAPRGRWSDTSSADTIGRMPTGSLIAPADLAAAADLAQELGALRELPLAPYATRTESTANYRRPNAIHGNGSPLLPQNAIFADWAHWRDHGRLNACPRGDARHGHAPVRPDSAAHIPSTRTSCDPLGKLIAKARKGERGENNDPHGWKGRVRLRGP
jgi:hypothetical protein